MGKGNVCEKVLQGRGVGGTLGHVMRSRTVNLEVKKTCHESMKESTLMYGNQTRTCNEGLK